jgi:class 3 adenylate cyclase/tetratricopeptide (TPR) repeat protein/ketosteroid isomerase-like protein
MICPSCTHDNRPSAKFCGGCGAPLQRACSKCGSELPPDVSFCDECGAPVSGAAPPARRAEPAGARKIVTILFADLVGSTGLHERLDPESARRFMESYYVAARGAVESHGGTVTQFLGDGVKAVFGIPRVAEDDAIRAVRAGVAMQEAFRALAEQQRDAVGETGLRVAVNTGEVVAKGESEIIGDPVNVAARLQERGRDGDVVIGESTRRLVASQISLEFLGSFDLKGRAEAVKAYRVVSLDAPGRAATTTFVGREKELARIAAVYDRAVETPAAHLAVLLGSPGLGKSRLIGEFARRSGETATVVAAHCDAAAAATFAPLADALRELLDIETGASPDSVRATVETALPANADPSPEAAAKVEAAAKAEAAAKERARIAAGIAGILTGSPGAPEETFFVVRRFLAGLATTRPVVLMIDDLQWAEPLLFDLVEHLVQWGRGLPLLVLIGARPELREVRSSFAMSGGLVADVITLDGLDAGAAMRLAAGVIGADDLPAAVAAKVLATSEGNPLFIGELVRMLVDEGALIRDGDRWKSGETLATVEMPPTIHALLAARIERLGRQQCTILERAAVVGRQFSRSAVAALLPSDGAGLDAQLESLQRAQLIERDTGWLLGEPVLRFHHVLIRDAAYRRLLKGTRAELHERLANWIEGRVGDAPEHDETIGRHLEEAHRLLGELGPIDDAGQILGERAATRLATAGRRALETDDVPLAAGLLGRAFDRLNADDPARAGPPSEAHGRRAELALDWCEALLAAGDVGAAARAIDELGRLVAQLDFDTPLLRRAPSPYQGEGQGEVAEVKAEGRLRAWYICFVGHHTVLTAPQELSATVELVAAAATSLASLNDAAGEAKAHFVHALALARLGKVGACEAALDQALAAARRAGDRRRANTVLALAPLAALWGPSPVTRASGRCLDVVRVLRITQGAPAVEAVALSCQGVLEALRGRTDAAHRMIASGRKMVEELGIAQRLFEADVFAGFVALLEGDVPAAERSLRGAYDGLRDLGLGIDAARAAALLARALLAQDRIDEAETLSHESEALAGDDLKAAIAWRGVRAEALARRGEHGAAIELAKAGVEIAAATDALLDHADARLALAAALRAAGRGAEADAEDRHAIEIWEAKGATLLVERAQQRVAKPIRPDRPPSPRGDYRGVDLPADKHPPGPLLGKEGESQRRVRLNAASTLMRRMEAGFAARDKGAIEALLSDPLHTVEHLTGATYGRQGQLESIERLLRLPNLEFRIELLATLGDALCLGRRRVTASGAAGGRFDVAEYEMDHIVLCEADARARLRLFEVFASEHLGEAITRLYERYAERLPDGPERKRAAATARSMGTMSTAPAVVDRAATVMASDFESVDHRPLSTWSMRGGGVFLEHLRALREVANDIVIRVQEVLALEPSAVLIRRMHSGTERLGGGAYERPFLVLFATASDGRLARAEWFDDDREAEALARFEEIARFDVLVDMGSLPSKRGGREGFVDESSEQIPLGPPFSKGEVVRRRVRANAATRQLEREWTAIEARDVDALTALNAGMEAIHHPTGATYGATEVIALHRGLWRGTNLKTTQDILATLGESLALTRRTAAHDGIDAKFGSVGPVEVEYVGVFEVDERTRAKRSEIFAGDRLGAAITRLYERYADLLPEGSQRERAVATARAVGWMSTSSSGVSGEVFSPAFEAVDHRITGYGALEGSAAQSTIKTWRELADDFQVRIDDVLAVTPDALLRKSTNSGFWRESGGAFARTVCALSVFGPDGLVVRHETFEADREAEALARFDALVVGAPPSPPRRVHANAATQAGERLQTAALACDMDAIAALCADELRVLHHPMGAVIDREGGLQRFRILSRAEGLRLSVELLATLGDSLALSRDTTAFDSFSENALDFGASETRQLTLFETEEHGRVARVEVFAENRLGDAIAGLYQRYAELLPEGAERSRAAAVAHAVAVWTASTDPEVLATAMAPSAPLVDHRVFATWSARDAAELLRHFRLQRELAPDFACCVEDVLALEPSAFLLRNTYPGTDRASGGSFENRVCVLFVCGGDGLVRHIEAFEAEGEAEALARFDALTSDRPPLPRGDQSGVSTPPDRPPPGPLFGKEGEPFDNAASRADREFVRRFNTRDWAGIEVLAAPELVFDERRRMLHNTCGREVWLEQLRVVFDVPASRFTSTLRATRGQRLALNLHCFAGEVAGGGGPLAIEDHFALHEVDGDGRIVAIVLFDLEAEDAAYAELDARYEAGEAARPTNNRLSIAGFVRAVERRDWDAVRALCREDFVERDHRGLAVLGRTEGAGAWVDNFHTLVELAPDTVYRAHHVLEAERGYFVHGSWYGTREGGPYELQVNAVLELDDAGRIRRADMYDDAVAEAAFARLAELGVDRPPLPRAVLSHVAGEDRSGVAAEPPPNRLLGETVDRRERPLDTPPKTAATRGEREKIYESRYRNPFAPSRPHFHSGRIEGPFARRSTVSGRKREAEKQRFANAATRAVARGTAALAARDWEAFAALMAPGFRHYDRTRIAQLESDGQEWLAAFRRMVDMTSTPPVYRLLATRGGRLALFEMLWRGAGGDVGPSEIEWRLIVEVNDRGEHEAVVVYDPDDLDAAYAELDARWQAGEAAEHPAASRWLADYLRFFAARDWSAMAALFAPDVLGENHRLVGWGRRRGPEGIVSTLQAQIELAPDTRERVDHVRTDPRALLFEYAWHGTREGGTFENVWVVLIELDAGSRARRVDVWEAEQLEQALARFGEIGESPGHPLLPSSGPLAGRPSLDTAPKGATVAKPNAAHAAMRRWLVTYDHAAATGDWDAMRELCAPHLVFDDRRRLALLSGGLDLMVASARERLAMGAWPRLELLGTAGERIATERVLWSGGPADGPFEIEYLGLWEVDETGRIKTMMLFDADEGPAVRREAWARWAAIDPDMQEPLAVISGLTDRFNDGDRAGVRALCADDLSAEDHRRTGIGRIDGADAFVKSLVALWKLAPDQRLELGWHWPAYGPHGGVTVVRRFGTLPDGGTFESEYLEIFVVAQGHATHLELFEIEDLDATLARFEELCGPSNEAQDDRPPLARGDHGGGDGSPERPPPNPLLGKEGERALRIPPNEATRLLHRIHEVRMSGDIDALREMATEDFRFEDRQKQALVVGGVEEWVGALDFLWNEAGARAARTQLIATAGDRLALDRVWWREAPGEAPFEMEGHRLTEVDSAGKLRAILLFDVDDRAAAHAELFERYVALGAGGMPQGAIEFLRGWNAPDLVRTRGGLCDDFVLDDHRRTGMGRLEGVDRYLESVAAIRKLIPDARIDALYDVAVERHGRVSVSRTWGHSGEGGEVELVFVGLMHYPEEKLSLFELFEVEHLDVALARLAELEGGWANAATRARDRQHSAFVARDWDAIRRLAAADFVLEDRGKRALVTGDVEAWIASMQFTSQPGFRPQSTLIGTFGNHIALDRVVWSGDPGGDTFEFERVRVLEADVQSHMRAVIMFDPEDHWPASYEAMTRFAAAEGAECAEVFASVARALNDERWAEARTLCTPDFTLVDHRPLIGLGTLDRKQWFESLEAADGLGEGLTCVPNHVLAWNENGLVVAVAGHGTVPDGGGDFHDGFLNVIRVAHGRLQRMDVFAEDDTEAALACFDEQRSRR